jgi:hypothetical protein
VGELIVNIERELLDRLRKDFGIKKNSSKDNTNVSAEISKLIPVIENHLKESNVEKTSNWMLFKDLWLQNESGHLKNSVKYRNYTRGSIIMSVDWGTSNLGTEIRYPHPGVVLYDQGEDWVIAVPITAAKFNREIGRSEAHPPFEVLALKQNSKPEDPHEYWFRKDSVIQVDQIQRISKYRILNKNSYKIRENLSNQIDNIVLEYYIPGKHLLMETLKDVISQKNEELKSANAEIQRLKEELKGKK